MRLGVNKINPLISGAAAVSVHAWLYPDSFSTSADNNRLFEFYINNGGSGILLGVHNGTSALVRVAGRSQAADSYQARNGTSTVSTGAWQSIGGVLNYAGDTITPYYNGAAENGGSATFGASSYTPGTPTTSNDTIGGDYQVLTANQTDGRLAEIAVWTSDIGASGYAALAKGVSALLVSQHTLAFYMPLLGNISPEPDYVGGQFGTITGTVAKADHQRIIRAHQEPAVFVPAASGGGGIVSHLIGSRLVGSPLVGSRLVG